MEMQELQIDSVVNSINSLWSFTDEYIISESTDINVYNYMYTYTYIYAHTVRT